MSETMTTSTNDIVDAFFTHFGAGDTEALLNLFADDVDFRVNGAANIPWAGTRSNKTEIGEFFGVFPEVLTAPDEFELTGRIVQDSDAAVFARCIFGVKATGKKFENAYALHFTIADDKIVRYHMYEDSHAIAQAFVAD